VHRRQQIFGFLAVLFPAQRLFGRRGKLVDRGARGGAERVAAPERVRPGGKGILQPFLGAVAE